MSANEHDDDQPDSEDVIARLREALRELHAYAASVWFDEAVATDEERELMDRARVALKGGMTGPMKSG